MAQNERTPSASRYLAYISQEAAAMDFDPIVALSQSRARGATLCRMRAWKHLRDDGFGLSGIGRVAGKDHTTILSGLRRIGAGFKPTTDLAGETIGHLTIVCRYWPPHESRSPHWRCVCSCGRTKFTTSATLKDKRRVPMCGFCRDNGPYVETREPVHTNSSGLSEMVNQE